MVIVKETNVCKGGKKTMSIDEEIFSLIKNLPDDKFKKAIKELEKLFKEDNSNLHNTDNKKRP